MSHPLLSATTRRLAHDHGSTWLFSDSAYWDRCPTGFVFPDDPTHPRNNYIGNSSCATACRVPFWTPEDYQNFDNMALYSSVIGIILFPILFFPAVRNFLRLPTEAKVQKKSYGLILLMVAMSGGTTFALALSPFTNDKTNMFCLNNAVPRRQDDGVSFCVAQGVLITYFPLAFMIAWVCQCIDIYMKVVLRMSSTAKYNGYFVGTSVLFPMLSVLVVALGDHEYGYSGQEQYCLVPPPLPGVVNYLYYVFDVPSYTCVVVGVSCLSAILLKFYRAWLTSRRLAAAGQVAARPSNRSGASIGSANPSMRFKGESGKSSILLFLSRKIHRIQPGGRSNNKAVLGGSNKNQGGGEFNEDEDINGDAPDSSQSLDIPLRVGAGSLKQQAGSSVSPMPPLQEEEAGDEAEAALVSEDKTSWEDNERGRAMRDMNTAKALTTPIIGCLLFGLYWAISALSNIPGIISAREDYNTKEAWIECVFSNFDGVSDDTWVDVCGVQPETYMGSAKPIQALFVIASFGQSLLVFLVYCKLVFFPARRVALPREYVHMVRRALSSAVRRQNAPKVPFGVNAPAAVLAVREDTRGQESNFGPRAPSYANPIGRGKAGGGGAGTGGGGQSAKTRTAGGKSGDTRPKPGANQEQGGGGGGGFSGDDAGAGDEHMKKSGTPGQDRVTFFKRPNQNGVDGDGNQNQQQQQQQNDGAGDAPGSPPNRTPASIKPGGGQVSKPRPPQHIVLASSGMPEGNPSEDMVGIETQRQTTAANPSPPARIPLVEVIAEAFAHDPTEAAVIVGNGVGDDSSSSMYVVHAGGGTAIL